MSQSQKPAGRKPATKFAQFAEEDGQGQTPHEDGRPMHVRKSGNR